MTRYVVPCDLAFGNKPALGTARHGSGLFPVPAVPFGTELGSRRSSRMVAGVAVA